MPEYFYNNQPITYNEILEAARFQNVTVEEYLNSRDDIKTRENIGEKQIGAWQSFKNNLSNTFEMVEDVTEFYGIGTGDKSVEQVAKEGNLGAYSGLSITATLLYESVFGKEKMKNLKEQYPNFFQNFATSDSETFQNIIKNFEKEKEGLKKPIVLLIIYLLLVVLYLMSVDL